MAERQVQRFQRYPKVEGRMRQHVDEKTVHMERVERILSDLGESTSTLKDTMMAMSGNMGAMMNAMADDEILKNSMANAAMAQFEIAAYESLITMGAAAGATEAIRTLQQTLSEERAMAAWLSDNLRGTVLIHMQLRSQGDEASR